MSFLDLVPAPPEAVPRARPNVGGSAAHRRLVALVAVAPLLANADQGIVSLALTSIRHDLSMSLTAVQWVANVYILLVGGLQLLGGRLADLAGARRLFHACLVGFAVSSAACGAAPTGELLIAARAVQAVAAALLVPAAMALLVTVATGPVQRARALALWAGVAGVGSVGGVTLGGLVVSQLDWRWAFYLNVPVAAGALLAARALPLPETARSRGTGLDLAGSAMLTGGLLALVYGLVQLPEHNAENAAWGALAAAALLGVAFVLQQRRCPAPLLPSAVIGERGLAAGALGILAISAATAPVAFLGSMYLQQVHHYGTWATGCALLPLVGGIALVGRASSRVLALRGPRIPCLTGCVLIGAGLLLLSGMSPASGYLTGVFPGMALVGAGLPMIWMTCEVVALAGVKERYVGLAAGVVQSAGQIGAALGLTLVVTVLTARGGPAEEADSAAVLSAQTPHAFLAAALLVVPALAGALVGMRPEAHTRNSSPAG